MSEFLTIACKMPHGYLIEVGYKVGNGADKTAVVRTDKYRSMFLKGWNSNNPQGQQPIALLRPEPGITNGVPKDLWEEWVKLHPTNRPLRNKLLYVVPHDADSALAVTLDHKGVKAGLEPIDPGALPTGITEAPVDGRPKLRVA